MSSQNEEIKIMTFNVFPDWSRNKYNKQTEERIKSYKKLFENMKHDIYCFQEVDFYYEWLKSTLDDFGYESYYTRKPDCFGNTHKRDGVVIAFKSERFKYEDYKPIEFPPIEGVNDGNVKAGTAALLVHLSLRNKPSIHFVVVTVHLAAFAENEEPRRVQIMHLLGRIYEYCKDYNYPVLLTGDFNTEENSETFNTIKASGYDLMSNTSLKSFPKRKCTIDFIFGLQKRFKCKSQDDLLMNLYSDHNPISCLIEIKNSDMIESIPLPTQQQQLPKKSLSPPLPIPISPVEQRQFNIPVNRMVIPPSPYNTIILQPPPPSEQQVKPPILLKQQQQVPSPPLSQQQQYGYGYVYHPYITHPSYQQQQLQQNIYSPAQQGVYTYQSISYPSINNSSGKNVVIPTELKNANRIPQLAKASAGNALPPGYSSTKSVRYNNNSHATAY